MKKFARKMVSTFITGMLVCGMAAGAPVASVYADEGEEIAVSTETDAVLETTEIEEVTEDTYSTVSGKYPVPEGFEESFPGVDDNSIEKANEIEEGNDYFGYVYLDYETFIHDEIDYYKIDVSEESIIEVSTNIIAEKENDPEFHFNIKMLNAYGMSIELLSLTDGVYSFYIDKPGTYYIGAGAGGNLYTFYSFNYSEIDMSEAEDEVVIDKLHFPDGIFREYVKQFDTDSSGVLSEEELGNVKSIEINNNKLQTLVGLKYFYNLEELNCIGSRIKKIDISYNSKLKKIQLPHLSNSLLDIRDNPNIEYINFAFLDGTDAFGGVFTVEDGEVVWLIYKGDEIATDYTGESFNEASDGSHFSLFYINGKGDSTINGVYRVKNNGFVDFTDDPYDIYIVKDGMVDLSQNDVFKEVTTTDGYTAWYYFVAGHRHFGYAGSRWTCENEDGIWLIRFGAIEHVTGLYDVNGNVPDSEIQNGSYYFDNGKLDTSKNGPVSGTVDGTKAWYYVKDGKVDFDFSDFAKVGSSWMYFSNGKVDKTINADHYGSFWGTVDGKGGWYVVKAGKAYPDYNGFALVGSSWMQYKNGQVDKSYTGTLNVNINGTKKWYYINKGKAILDYTGFGKVGSSWMRFKNGEINKTVTGIISGTVNGTKAQWYVKAGKVQLTYSGTYKKNGKTYTIKNGKVTKVS